jgi:predicted nucleic acid-binding protein
MIVVTDAGPLIYLAGGGQLPLLRLLYTRVVVPRIVFEEVTVAGVGLVGASEVVSAEWLEVIDRAADRDLLDVLDAGEAAAIPLAEELGAVLLVDDGAARAVAFERGIAVVGSLGVLLTAKRRGHLDALAPVLDRMVALGMFVAPALRTHVLALAGESGTEGG